MPLLSVPLRTGVGGVIAASLILGGMTPAMAAPPADPQASYLESSPVEASGHSGKAEFVQIPTGAYNPFYYAKLGLQAVNDSQNGETSLEAYGIYTGKMTSHVDLSDEFTQITSASAYFDDDAESALRVVVRGQRNGQEHVALVSSTSGDEFVGSTVTSLDDKSAVELASLRDLAVSGVGLLAVNENEAGEYVATRLKYDLQPVEGRSPVQLGLKHSRSVFIDGNGGDIYALGEGQIQQTSIYSTDSVSTVVLPGFSQVTQVTPIPGQILVADDTNHLAIASPYDGSITASVTLPGAASSITYNLWLGEILAASADGKTIWRYATDGTPRVPVSLGEAAVQPGSLNSATTGNTTHTFTASVGGKSFRYTMTLVARYSFTDIPPITAPDRETGIAISFGSLGSTPFGEDGTYSWEYSLDGGANWAKQENTWDTAIPDAGSTNTPRPELPAPLDGTAPYLRADVSADGTIGTSFSGYEGAATVPEGGYDALWRVRIDSLSGSVASEPQRVVVGSGDPDPHPRFTQHPASLTANVGQDAKFTVAVTGDPAPTVSWQIKRAGGDWESLNGAGAEARFSVDLGDDKAEVRATATNGSESVTSQSARVTVLSAKAPDLGAAPAGAQQVEAAAFNWQLNTYSHEWARDAFGAGAQVNKEQGFDFLAGTGWTKTATGETQLVWPGVATYRPYGGMNGLNLSFANPYLAIGADGRGTLTADFFWNNGGGMGGSGEAGTSGGFHRVVIATYTDAQVKLDGGRIVFSATPEWEHRPYIAPGLGETREYASSFPASFLDYLDRGLRPWFLPTGSRNDEKAGIAISGSATLSETAARTDGQAISATDPLGDGAQHFADAAPKITSQPANVSAIAGEHASIVAEATGIPAPSVVWQRRIAGSWVNIEGATSPTLELVDLVEGSYTVRAEFKNRRGSVTSDEATITVSPKKNPGEIQPQPITEPQAPVAEGSDLTDAQRGGAHFAQSGASVIVTDLQPGEWYFATMYSKPQGLGWVRADASGRVAISLPSAAKPEAHRITLQNAAGELVGWADVSIGANTESGAAGVGSTQSPAAAGTSAVAGSTLAETGTGVTQLWLFVAGLLLLGGVSFTARSARRKRVTQA